MKSIFAVAAGLGLLLAASACGQETDARAILKSTAENYAGLPAFRATGQAGMTMQGAPVGFGGTNPFSNVTFSIALKKPGSYRIVWQQGGGPRGRSESAVWNAGDGAYLCMGIVGSYTRLGRDEMAISGATGISAGVAQEVPALFFSDLELGWTFAGLQDPELVGSEKIGDEDCHVIRGEVPSIGSETVWISKKRNLLIRSKTEFTRTEEDFTAPDELTDAELDEAAEAMGLAAGDEARRRIREIMERARNRMRTSPIKGLERTIRYTEIETGGDLGAADLTYTVPEGTVLRDGLMGLSAGAAACAAPPASEAAEEPGASEPEEGEGDIELSCEFVIPDRSGDHTAFSVMHVFSERRFTPVVVVDSTGKEVARTEPPTDGVYVDVCLTWLPGTNSLLYLRFAEGEDGSYRRGPSGVHLLDCSTGQSTPVDLGGGRVASAVAIDAETLVCRVEDGAQGPGLYLHELHDGEWTARPLLLDGEGSTWQRCLWGRRDDRDLHLLVRGWQDAGPDSDERRQAFQTVHCVDGAVTEERLVVSFERGVTADVSQDGAVLAVVRTRRRGRSEVLVIETLDGETRPQPLPSGPDVSYVSLHSGGHRALVWEMGFFDGIHGPLARLLYVDLRAQEVRDIHLPADLSKAVLAEAVWLEGDTVLLSLYDRGLVKLNVETGQCEDFWLLPEEPSGDPM